MAVDEERLEAAAINSAGEKGEQEGRVRLHRARGSEGLGKVASGGARQRLWLRNGKVGSQIIGENQSRHPGRGTVWEVRRGEK